MFQALEGHGLGHEPCVSGLAGAGAGDHDLPESGTSAGLARVLLPTGVLFGILLLARILLLFISRSRSQGYY